MCKGSGMIHPNMCTMLSFLMTDAAISKEMLQKALSADVDDTYNMISVDGDTSTNDTCLLLANGLAENPEITEKNADYEEFCKALNFVNDTAKKLTGITEQTGILAIKNSEGCFDEVLTAVQKIADKNEKIEVNTIEQTIKNIQYRYSASINALYMTSAILFVFGSISLTNMLMVDFQNRKREFGLLEAVGTTRQQLKAMLDREMGIYLGGSLVIALVFGSILSVIVCRRLDAVNHCITLVLPWLFLLALVVVLAVIYLIFTAYAKSELKKTSILSAIREE